MGKSSKTKPRASRTKLENKFKNKKSKNKRKTKKGGLSALKQSQRASESSKVVADPAFEPDVNAQFSWNGNCHSLDLSEEDINQLLARQSLDTDQITIERNENLGQKRKRMKENGSDEQGYEKVPRKLSKGLYHAKEDDLSHVQLLPIKGKDGIIERMRENIQETSIDDDNLKDKEESDVKEKPKDDVPKSVSMIELYAERQKKLASNKMQIATLCQEIIENPEENIKKLKNLLEFCGRKKSVTIRKLAIVSLMEIFKDITPGYRIRALGEDELAVKVSKDVRRVRDFEEGLISSYKSYLDVLEEIIQDYLKLSGKRNGELTEMASSTVVGNLAMTAVKCMCELLKELSHFNYRTNLIVFLVPKMDLWEKYQEIADICTQTVKNLLSNDYTGDISLDIVKVISKLAKSRLSKLHPQVLETLLCLNIDAGVIKEAEARESKTERIRKKKEQLKKMSRKEKKRQKVEAVLDKELQEVQATENRQKRQKLQTDILKFLFVIYFRVLKYEKKTELLPPVLRGLSKFAHLINIDFFSDIMISLKRLINSEELSLNESLHCILTTFRILSGQGETLNIDPQQFYIHLYYAILQLGSETCQENAILCKECLDIMLIKRRKNISFQRVLGFLKRISTILLDSPSENIFGLLTIFRSVLQLHRKTDCLLDNETIGRGLFQPELVDPELCNADSTAMWELSLASKHFYFDVRDYVKHLLAGAPSHGQGSLNMRLAQRVSFDSVDPPALEFFLPSSVPQSKSAKKRKSEIRRWTMNDFQTYVENLSCQQQTETDMNFMNSLLT